MWSLMRRDPYLQHTRLYLLFAAFIGVMTVAIQNQGPMPMGPWFLYANFMLVAVLPLLRSETFHFRFSELPLTLPVSTEELARARLLAMLVACGTPLLTACTIFMVRASATPGKFADLLGLVGSFALAVVVHNFLAIDSNEIRPSVLWTCVAVLVAGIAATLHFRSELYGTMMLVIAASFAAVVWRRAPHWLPGQGGRLRTETEAAIVPTGRVTRAILVRETLGGPVKAFQSILHAVFIPAFLFAPGGFDTSLTFGPIFAFFFYSWNLRLAQILRTTGHLPIDRRRLALALVLPGLIVGAISIVVAGRLIGDYWGWQKSYAALTIVDVAVDGDEYYADTDTPPTLWQIHLGFGDPLIGSPQGETHPLTSHRLVPMAPFAFYNPYEIPQDASLSFAAWQIQRLVADAHGIDLTLDEIQRRYIYRHEDGLVHRRRRDPDTDESNPFEHDFEDAALLGRTDVVYGSLVAFLLFWTATAALAFRPRQYPRARLKWRNLTWRSIVLAAAAAVVIVSMLRFTGYDTAGVLRGASFRSLGAWLPSPAWLAAVVFALLTVLAVIWISSLIRKMDVPPPLPPAGGFFGPR